MDDGNVIDPNPSDLPGPGVLGDELASQAVAESPSAAPTGDAPGDAGTTAPAMTEDDTEAVLRRLIGNGRRFPADPAIAAVPGLKDSIERTGGVERWRRRLGVARRKPLTDDEVESRLRSLVEQHGRFPTTREAGKPLLNAMIRTGGYQAWAERVGVPPPAYALSADDLVQLRASGRSLAERYEHALRWCPPETLPDSEAGLVSLIAAIDEILEQLRAYGLATQVRIAELTGPRTPGKGVVDTSQGHARRQQRAERAEERRLQALLELDQQAKKITGRIRDAQASHARATEQLQKLRRRTEEP